jgi:predicted DNA-binding protein (MmcQ/YjbR family)
MTYVEFKAFCRALPMNTYVVQWGGSHVWKIGRKVFAMTTGQDGKPRFAFKVSDIAYEMPKDQPGRRPAPYLASRGGKWIQHLAKPGVISVFRGLSSAFATDWQRYRAKSQSGAPGTIRASDPRFVGCCAISWYSRQKKALSSGVPPSSINFPALVGKIEPVTASGK